MEDWEILVTVWKSGKVQGTLRFDQSPVTIGAASDNDVVLSDREVSSSHGKITVTRERLAYRDFSTNGSFVGRRRVSETVLETEDRLSIPPFEIRSLLLKVPGSRRTFLRPVSDLIATIDAAAQAEAAEPSPALGLLIVRGPADLEGSWLELPEGPQCIGRSEGADLRFDLPTLSRLHAVVQHEGGDIFTVQDLASSNGIFVNGQRTPVADLHEGDEIRMGRELVLRLEPRSKGADSQARDVANDDGPDEDKDRMEVQVEEIENENRKILVFDIGGELVGKNTARSLTLHLDRTVEMQKPLVAIGLAGVEEIDRLALATLAKAIDALNHLDAEIRLFAVPEKIREFIDRSRLKIFFKGRLDEDRETALEALVSRSTEPSP